MKTEMASKKDLARFVTKEEMEAFQAVFARRSDLEDIATTTDIEAVSSAVESVRQEERRILLKLIRVLRSQDENLRSATNDWELRGKRLQSKLRPEIDLPCDEAPFVLW
jgi:hypothetical protein